MPDLTPASFVQHIIQNLTFTLEKVSQVPMLKSSLSISHDFLLLRSIVQQRLLDRVLGIKGLRTISY